MDDRYCEYERSVNYEIRDQVIHKCKSSKLRTCLLQVLDLTLEKCQNIGKIMEQSSTQSKSIEESSTHTGSEEVNNLKHHSRSKDNFNQRDFRRKNESCERCCTR